MKFLKIFGVVAGIHIAALVLIFANPGCSTMARRAPAQDAAMPQDVDSRVAPVPPGGGNDYNTVPSGANAEPPLLFLPGEPTNTRSGNRFSPTRPGTPIAEAVEVEEPVANVIPVKTYTVVKGDSLWGIAHRNGLSVAELTAANTVARNATLRVGQKLIIPEKSKKAAPKITVEGKRESSSPTSETNKGKTVTHVVKTGETLGGIARHYGVKLSTIATRNNISDPRLIRVGEKLVIPGWVAPKITVKAPVVPKPAPDSTPSLIPPGGAEEAPVRKENPPVLKTTPRNPVLFTLPSANENEEGKGSAESTESPFKEQQGAAPVIQIEESPQS